MPLQHTQDVIIIGGSYAGLAAAMALGRALRSVLIIDGGKPCNRQTPHSHNFLTQDGSTPKMIADLAKAQVLHYPTIQWYEGLAMDVIRIKDGFEIETDDGQWFSAKKLVFATGIRDVLPSIPGLEQCWGISVLHCPFCHGYEVRQQPTVILGNGDSGFEMAALLSNWTHDLTVYTNGTSSFTEEQLQKMAAHAIRIEEEPIDRLIHHDGHVQQVLFNNGNTAAVQTMYVRAPFVQHSPLPEKLGCEFTPEGYIKTEVTQQTNIPDVFACGDNSSRMRTVANAIASGTTAGISLTKMLVTSNF